MVLVRLVRCFNYLLQEWRENVLLDLVHALPAILKSPNVQHPTTMLLSEAIPSTMTKLREGMQHQAIVQSHSGELEDILSRRIFDIFSSNSSLKLQSLKPVNSFRSAPLDSYSHRTGSMSIRSRPQEGGRTCCHFV